MIDPPVVQRALKLVARAQAMGSWSPSNASQESHHAGRADKTELTSAQRRRTRGPDHGQRQAADRRIWAWASTSRAGSKAGPPIRTAADYPENGDKRVPDLETALRKCGLRDGMVIS